MCDAVCSPLLRLRAMSQGGTFASCLLVGNTPALAPATLQGGQSMLLLKTVLNPASNGTESTPTYVFQSPGIHSSSVFSGIH